MRKVKWVFFGYLGLCVLVIAGIGVSFAVTRTRDPNTNYTSYAANIKSLDPAEITDTESGDIAGNIFECLYNYQYGHEPYTLEPELADADYTTTPDGKTATIGIKRGVHFYDPDKTLWPDGVGPEVTAADFVYSWKRVCNFHLGITANYSQVFQGHVVGIDDWYNYTQSCRTPGEVDWDRPVSGLTAVDRYTLRVKLVDPFPQFKFNLAMIPTAVVCRQVVDQWGGHLKNHPVGTGAYVLQQNLPEQQIVMVANPAYRGGPTVESGAKLVDADRLPHVRRVQYNFYAEDLPRWFIFLQGDLDANGIPKDTFNQAIHIGSGELTDDMTRQGIRLIKAPAPEVSYTGFNMADPVVGRNKPLRQAMSMAYDRQKFIDLYNERPRPAGERADPAGGSPRSTAAAWPPTARSTWRRPGRRWPRPSASTAARSPRCTCSSATPTRAPRRRQTSSSRRCGRSASPSSRSIRVGPGSSSAWTASRRRFSIWAGWPTTRTSRTSGSSSTASSPAPAGSTRATMSTRRSTRSYEQSSVMDKGPARDALYLKMQAMVVEDCPWIFKFYPVGYTLYHGWEKGVRVMDYGHGTKANLRIDFDERARWLRGH